MPFAEVDGATIFYTDEGTGEPPVLFVHGYSCDSHDWSWQIPHFVATHRVVACDNRGHGRSSVPEDGYDHLGFAADIARLLEQLNCGAVVAVGHSLGGVIVSTLAVERPELVRAVVNIDPGYLLPEGMREAIVPILAALASDDPRQAAQAMIGSAYTPATPPALIAWHMRRIAGDPAHVLRDTMTNLIQDFAFESSSAPYLLRRQCPVLSFYADPSRAAIEEPLLADPRSKIVCFEGSGHWLHQERPDEVNFIIDAWLSSL